MLYVKKNITVVDTTFVAAKRRLKKFKLVLDSHPNLTSAIPLQYSRSKVQRFEPHTRQARIFFSLHYFGVFSNGICK